MKIVEEMKENPNEYAGYVDGNFQNHVEQMQYTDGRKESYASEAEIMAATKSLGIDIFIRIRN